MRRKLNGESSPDVKLGRVKGSIPTCRTVGLIKKYMITTTKIKRILARFGIGSPLNILIYTREEIEKMPKFSFEEPRRGRGRPVGSKNRKSSSARKAFVIKHGRIIVTAISFDTFEEAFKWAEWNYKGRLGNIDIIKNPHGIA